ncbi:MAG: 5-(carboxyamino)imidazole ribonucleotide synthase [Polyangiaceae bacterium]|nr:5-(carboxyamino)imidazole ribonucleotide synthase [Polyangiaceae bacterium]
MIARPSSSVTARVGILGGGQLGMMLAGSLYKLGADVALYDPDPHAPARRRYAHVTTAAWTDRAALARFFSEVDVVTYEFENVDATVITELAGSIPFRPGLSVLTTTQDRLAEKRLCRAHGLPHARFEAASCADELREVGRAFGLPFIVKTARGGYDGKGQARVVDEASLDRAAAQLFADGAARRSLILEEIVPFTMEASCIVARDAAGRAEVFPVFENHHERHVLDWTLVPARLPPAVADAAREIALDAARAMDVVGLLTTELFVAQAGAGGRTVGEHAIFVNEFAPRPHNSGHVTRTATTLSQFDALARILCELPLSSPRLLNDGAFVMGNLLGDLWLERGAPHLAFEEWARHPEVLDVVLYGKHEARPGRKMGHFVAHAPDPSQAIDAVAAFRRALGQAHPAG